MWENIIQSVRKVKSGDKGLGCILAHTMGLGKTFQVFGSSISNVPLFTYWKSGILIPFSPFKKNDK